MCQVKRSAIVRYPVYLMEKLKEVIQSTPQKIQMKRYKNHHTFLRIDTAVQSVPIFTQSRDHDRLIKQSLHRPIQRSVDTIGRSNRYGKIDQSDLSPTFGVYLPKEGGLPLEFPLSGSLCFPQSEIWIEGEKSPSCSPLLVWLRGQFYM
jgi:hypothetical protein